MTLAKNLRKTMLSIRLGGGSGQIQVEQDKVNAVRRNAEQIKRVEGYLKRVKKNAKAQQTLKESLKKLEEERFELLKNEILNSCKSGFLDVEKLRKIPGSKKYIEELKNKKEPI
ncbi:MAG: hypothetical protein ACETWQ_22485 [Phycisphaerae bacterium]